MTKEVNYNISKALKEKKFNEICDKLWTFNGDECIKLPNKNSENIGFSAPTISQVVNWIVNTYEIWICVDKAEDSDGWKFHIRILLPFDMGYKYGGFGDGFVTHYLAYESAIEFFLEHFEIINNQLRNI